MSIRLVVADTDKEYLKRLMDVLQGYDDLQLSYYSNKESLQNGLLNKRIDVLLYSPDIYNGELFSDNVASKIMLYDEDRDVNEAQQKVLKIRKYQRISRIYQEILEAYAEVSRAKGVILGGKKTKFFDAVEDGAFGVKKKDHVDRIELPPLEQLELLSMTEEPVQEQEVDPQHEGGGEP